jgi:hypothetical protein
LEEDFRGTSKLTAAKLQSQSIGHQIFESEFCICCYFIRERIRTGGFVLVGIRLRGHGFCDIHKLPQLRDQQPDSPAGLTSARDSINSLSTSLDSFNTDFLSDYQN